MKPIWVFILILFLSGLYVSLNYTHAQVTEGFQPRCPNILIQDGNEILLKNTRLAEVPGVNPVVFRNLDEYTEFYKWQQSQGIKCPILYLEKSYSTQNEPTYTVKPLPKQLTDASRTNNPPYNTNSYPGMDPQNQDVGSYTVLDAYHDVEKSQPLSKNPIDTNWGGNAYTNKAVEKGIYKGNEVLTRPG
jgi:hypothetical protein